MTVLAFFDSEFVRVVVAFSNDFTWDWDVSTLVLVKVGKLPWSRPDPEFITKADLDPSIIDDDDNAGDKDDTACSTLTLVTTAVS